VSRNGEVAFALLTGAEKDLAALQAAVAGCGGWGGLIAEWRGMGGEFEVLACLWELRSLLNSETEAVAAQLGVEEEFIQRFVWTLEEHTTQGKLLEAAGLGAWLAEVLSLHMSGSDDPVVQAGAAWWRERWEALRSAKSVK
jgi:hypothetical protein